MSKTNKIRCLQESGTLNSSPEKVTDTLFQKKDFFDAYDLLQVKYEMLRRVIFEKWSITQATKQFGFSRPVFYQIQRAFEQDGLAGLFPKKRGPKSSHKLNNDVIDYIKKILEKSPLETPTALTIMIKKKFKITIHPRSVRRVLLEKKN